ncbi:NudC domain-containing protein 2 [Liparis tanakae]|uniref:NudC domain-containing protein 2 n=1 Tax=Liparis tanakae TaxID=230148 RepID=A0A4Z2H917_9TELE|nr:NudC domain-containing protein 2 [Liparis tanakae]
MSVHFEERSGVVPCETPWGSWYQTMEEVFIEVDVPHGTSEDKCLIRIILMKTNREAGNCWSSLLEGEYCANAWVQDQMQRKLTLERFQRENPGFDFSGAEISGNFAGGERNRSNKLMASEKVSELKPKNLVRESRSFTSSSLSLALSFGLLDFIDKHLSHLFFLELQIHKELLPLGFVCVLKTIIAFGQEATCYHISGQLGCGAGSSRLVEDSRGGSTDSAQRIPPGVIEHL